MKILVTGSGGFIGGHLVRTLEEYGHIVYTIDIKDGVGTDNYSATRHFVERYQPDMIAHLGANCSTAISLRNPILDFQLNVQGTFNICEVSRKAGGIPILFTSTCKVHPGEDGLLAPLGTSKRVGEEYLNLYSSLYGVPVVINRPSTVYGPGQDGSKESGWVATFVEAAHTGQPLTLYGDGTQSRDILYIEDFVNLLVDQITNFSLYVGGTYAVGGGRDNEVSLIQMLDHLRYTNIQFAPRLSADIQQVITDNTEVSRVNGWNPLWHWTDGVDCMRSEWETKR